jgi:hypothetical protein
MNTQTCALNIVFAIKPSKQIEILTLLNRTGRDDFKNINNSGSLIGKCAGIKLAHKL